MDLSELTKWVVNRGDDLYSISTQVDFKRKLDKYYAEQLRLCGVGVRSEQCEHDWKVQMSPRRICSFGSKKCKKCGKRKW